MTLVVPTGSTPHPSLVEAVEAKAVSLGVVMRKSETLHPIPITLQPLVIPRVSFAHVCSLMPLWNIVIDNVARNYDFLVKAIEPIANSDKDFTGKLFEMYRRLYAPQSGVRLQQSMLGIFRSDYMRERNPDDLKHEWKHVEINTIAASFGSMSTKAGLTHRYLANSVQRHPFHGLPTPAPSPDSIEVSPSLQNIAAGLAAAHFHWCGNVGWPINLGGPVVCFVVEDGERNTTDQYMLALELLETHGVASIRKSFNEIQREMKLVPHPSKQADDAEAKKMPDHHAVFPVANNTNTQVAVSVFYFRTGYSPNQLETPEQWQARETIERSSGIKCPSLPYHLCTTKQIQQLLSKPAILRQFCSDETAVLLESCFVGQYPVKEYLKDVVPDAIAHPKKYVLKTQREGGGNLITGDELVQSLKNVLAHVEGAHGGELTEKDRHVLEEYLLMVRIDSALHPGSILKDGKAHFFDKLMPELGTFGVILSTGRPQGAEDFSSTGHLVRNEYSGYLVRTKPSDVEDGGVMTGRAALDAIALLS
jgi:glutathione synthetase